MWGAAGGTAEARRADAPVNFLKQQKKLGFFFPCLGSLLKKRQLNFVDQVPGEPVNVEDRTAASTRSMSYILSLNPVVAFDALGDVSF